MIEYRTEVGDLRPEQLRGFFEGWSDPPSPEMHLRLLKGSWEIVLAFDTEADRVVGFISAVSDGVLAAYVPLLEVLASHRHRGIASELVQRLFARLSTLYMIDLICDPPLTEFYSELGMTQLAGMVIRNAENQSGRQIGSSEQHC